MAKVKKTTIREALFGQVETSGTSQAVATGVKTFTLDVDNGYTQVDYTVQIVSTADRDCWMYGVITAKASPSITVNVFKVSPTVGTFTDWEIQVISGPFAGLPASSALGFSSDSASVPAIGTVLNWTIETGKAFYDNSTVHVFAVNDITDYFFATVVDYNSGTGALKLVVNRSSGSGSNSLWAISLIDVTQSFRTTVGNANYSIKASDKIVALTSELTTNRTWTLPLASSVPAGYSIALQDAGDNLGSWEVRLTCQLSDNLNGGTAPSFIELDSAFFHATVFSDGVSNWTMDPKDYGQLTNPTVVVSNDFNVTGLSTFYGDVNIGDLMNSTALTVWGNTTLANVLAANLRDSTTVFYDNADSTKTMNFQLSGITTGTNRVLTVPDAAGEITLNTAAQTLSNKTLAASTTYTNPTINTANDLLVNIPGGLVGYTTGAGGSVTQTTSKSTAVTLNTPCGSITTDNAALGAFTTVTFTVNCSRVSLGDVVIANVRNNTGHTCLVNNVLNGSFDILLTNQTGGSLSQAVTINFAIINCVAN